MKQYVISVIIVAVACCIVSVLSPEGEGGGIAKHVKLLCGICIILVCFEPAHKAIEFIYDFDVESVLPDTEQGEGNYQDIFDGAYSAAEAENLKDGIVGLVSERYGLDPLTVDVSLSFSGEGAEKRLSCVTLTLYGSSVWADTGSIESYLGSLLGCKIITIIGWE